MQATKGLDQKDAPAGHQGVVGMDGPACQMVHHPKGLNHLSSDHSSPDRSSQDRLSQDRLSQVGRKIRRHLLMDRSRALEALCSIHAAYRREGLPPARRPVG
jgi:hypothetical protein